MSTQSSHSKRGKFVTTGDIFAWLQKGDKKCSICSQRYHFTCECSQQNEYLEAQYVWMQGGHTCQICAQTCTTDFQPRRTST